MISHTRWSILIALSAIAAHAEGFIQVSKTISEPSHLTCEAGLAATIVVSIYFAPPLEGNTPLEATVRINNYSGSPTDNKLHITEAEKVVRLEISPALAQFRVECGPDTVPGDVRIISTLVKGPKGLEILASEENLNMVKIVIDKPPPNK